MTRAFEETYSYLISDEGIVGAATVVRPDFGICRDGEMPNGISMADHSCRIRGLTTASCK